MGVSPWNASHLYWENTVKTFEITYQHESNAYPRKRIIVKANGRDHALIAGDRQMASAGYDGEWNPCNIAECMES